MVLVLVVDARPDRAADVRDRVRAGRWPAGGAADPSSGDFGAHGRGAQHAPFQGGFRVPEGVCCFSAFAPLVRFVLAWR